MLRILRTVLAAIVAAGVLAGTAAAPALAQSQAGASIRESALKIYRADEIGGLTNAGTYVLPAASDTADAGKARGMLALAATLGDKDAGRQLGRMMEAGIGGPQDYVGARHAYRRSGERTALWYLGRLILAGKGGPADPVGARAVFKEASSLGSIDARFQYARMYELGIGGPRDPDAARRLYESTREYCHGDIANHLAMMLMRGIGGPADKVEAADRHLRAVECHNQYFDTPVIQLHPSWIDGQTVKEAQKLLRRRGIYDGPVNGELNPATRAAIAGLE